jgi:hypothetical protein
MNHQPFETWLLDDLTLDAEAKGKLQGHLRTCAQCSALAETGLALHSTRERGQAAPASGFILRFQQRLAAHKLAERRRKLWGMVVFVLGGLSLLAWLVAPILAPIFNSPAESISLLLSYLFFLSISFQVVGEVGLMFVRVAPGFVPPFAWLVLASTLAGFGLVWFISIWRLTYAPRGV